MQDLRERRGSFLLCACCHEVLEGSSEPKRYKEQMKALMPRLVSSLERGIPGSGTYPPGSFARATHMPYVCACGLCTATEPEPESESEPEEQEQQQEEEECDEWDE